VDAKQVGAAKQDGAAAIEPQAHGIEAQIARLLVGGVRPGQLEPKGGVLELHGQAAARCVLRQAAAPIADERFTPSK